MGIARRRLARIASNRGRPRGLQRSDGTVNVSGVAAIPTAHLQLSLVKRHFLLQASLVPSTERQLLSQHRVEVRRLTEGRRRVSRSSALSRGLRLERGDPLRECFGGGRCDTLGPLCLLAAAPLQQRKQFIVGAPQRLFSPNRRRNVEPAAAVVGAANKSRSTTPAARAGISNALPPSTVGRLRCGGDSAATRRGRGGGTPKRAKARRPVHHASRRAQNAGG